MIQSSLTTILVTIHVILHKVGGKTIWRFMLWVVLGVRLPKMSRATAHTISTVVVPMVPAGAV